MDLVPGSGRFLGEETGNPFQYSCLVNLMDRGTWWATVHGVAKSGTWFSDETSTTKSSKGGLERIPQPLEAVGEHFLSDLYYASSHENHPIYLCL